MKFKGTFSDRGLRTLQKGGKSNLVELGATQVEVTCCTCSAGLLPTLEKFGKTCQLLLSPEDLHFVQSTQDTDGMLIAARFAVVCQLNACCIPSH